MKSRRGLSSVVGAVFAIIALSTVIGYITYSMDVLNNYNQSVLIRTRQITDTANEKSQVTSVSYVNNKFSIIVNNTGSLPINFTKIWIANKTASACTTYSCNINYAPNAVVVPGRGITLGQSMPGTINATKPYHVKLVTSRGNTNEFDVNSVSSAPVNIQFYALPSNVTNGYTTQLVMVVKNNGSGTLTNIVPVQPAAGAGAANYVLSANPIPKSYNTLPPGSTAVFDWNATMTGNAGDSRTFTASLQNGFAGNTATTTVHVGTVSSVASAPLNIQLLALPVTVPGGFKSELVMVVANNMSGTLTNITPTALPNATYTGSGSTSCVAGSVSPAKYTLAPGQTGIFTWDVTANGAGADTCTYTITQPLQGGYSQTVSATMTITVVSLSSTGYAQNSGVVSDTYTQFRWTQGGSWHNHWSFPSATTTDFSMVITNNNQTGGGYKLWLSANTQMYLLQTQLPANGKIVATPFFIVKAMPSNPATPPSLTGLGYPDYFTGVDNAGGQATLYFGASAAGGTTQQTTSNMVPGTYFGFVLIYGKFAINSGDTGSSYAQAIPFLAVVMT